MQKQQFSDSSLETKMVLDDNEEEEKRSCWWWRPAQNSLSVAFCNETSIHGFKFLGQEKRHMSERIFWLIGFFSSLSLAIYLIWGVYDRYQKVPVIVSFQSKELGMDRIPFPAVTLCNMNKFPKTGVEALQKIANDLSNPDNKKARKQLIFIRNACNAQQSFAKDFNYAFNRGSNKKKQTHSHGYNNPYSYTSPKQPNIPENDNETVLTESDQKEMTDFLLQNTISCKELIRLCMLGEEKVECGKLFKPIITDYGKCCTFNILPLPLLLKNPDNANKTNASVYDNPVLGSNAEKHWPMSEIKNWSKWEYDEGFVLEPNSTNPWRQKRAGLPYGLSMLVDPNTDDYYCPASDSLGMRYILHTPLEMPHVMEFSSMLDLEKEVLIEVHPDVTNADDDIRSYEPEKRLCVFGKEKDLRYYGPYTGGNCVDECTAKILIRDCNCTLFYMPRDDGVNICNSDPDSDDHECTEDAKMMLQKNIKKECGHCDTLCEDIAYNYETTIADMQPNKDIWGDPNPTYHPNGTPPWANHKMSIVHIFFGAESTVPKFRKRLYGITDLIANTGGILGLCLGFSILSGVEVIYFFTIRAFWKYCRKRANKKRKEQQEEEKANNFVANLLFQRQRDKVIKLNPNEIPVYPYDVAINARGWRNAQGHHFYGHKSFQTQNQGFVMPNNALGYTYY